MDAVNQLATGIEHLDALLAEPMLQPDLARDDWAVLRTRVKLVHDAVLKEVLGALDGALRQAEDDEIAGMMKRRVAALLGEVAALVYATGDAGSCAALLAKAAELTPDPDHRSALDAAQAEPEVHCRLEHARWLQNHRRNREAGKVLKSALRAARRPALRQAVKEAQRAPRPIEGSPPALFRLNGCGLGLYGKRDPAQDGSYIATYCISLLWVPVFPLTAYRVRRVDTSSYEFRAREVLGPIARAWQALVLAGAVLGLGAWGVTGYLESPARRVAVALDEARAAEAAGDRERALERYKSVIEGFELTADVKPAAEAVVRLAAAGVAEPAAPASVEAIGRVVNAFHDLPPAARAGAPAALLTKQLAAWAEQIGDGSAEQAGAGLVVLDMAGRVAGSGAEAGPIDARRAQLRRAFADRIAEARPLMALDQYTRIQDAGALDAARKILDTFGDAPSLWLEAEAQVGRFAANAAANPGHGADRDAAQGRLAAAHRAHAEDEALIEAGDEKAMAKALEARPGDQELVAALAELRRGQGDVKRAIALLEGLGPHGRLTAETRLLLGSCHSDAGALDKADEVLTGLLDERLPAFQEAQRALIEATREAERKVTGDLRRDDSQPELESRMQAAGDDEAAQREVFQGWVDEQIDKDPALVELRAEYMRHGAVVPASLSLGMVKLRRAADARGDERRVILDAAERAFLAIRREAAGEPTFHLGLGQVYHRLGRAKDGDAELQGVLDRRQPELSLAVAKTYRELGLETRARQVAEEIYNTATEPQMKYSAANFLAYLVHDLEEQETWARRSDTSDPGTRNLLDDIGASKLLRDGKLAEAEIAFAKVARFHEREAKREPISANNAAVAYGNRYRATGDVAHLRSAVGHLGTAAGLQADSALGLGNFATALALLGKVTVLERWVRTRALLLDDNDADFVIGAMLDGALRGELIAALQRDPSFRKALAAVQQQQVLAPEMIAGYERQIQWLSWSEDAKGLGDLAKRLEAMPPLKGEDGAAEQARWEAGERDAQHARYTADALAHARRRLERAEKAGHKPTRAVAWLSLGDALSDTAYLAPEPQTIDAMVAAYRSASEAWPEGLGDRDLAGALHLAAFYKALSASPALKKAWDTERRGSSWSRVLTRAMSGPAAAEVLAAVRQQPELREAAQLRKANLGERPSTLDWLLAREAGDAELEQAAAKAFERATLELRLKLEVKLSPGQASEQAELDLFMSKGKAL